MTLQQLEYIVAVDKYSSFVQASDSCGVTQSTLSTMIQKLENELDVVIFDRNSRPIRTTMIGEQIVNQAKTVLFNVRQLDEMVKSEQKLCEGEIKMSFCPTIAPYITPKLFKYLKDRYPKVTIRACEMSRDEIIEKLCRTEIDMAVMSCPQKNDQLLEIPLYREQFLAYVSPMSPLYKEKNIDMQTMPRERLWGLKDEISLQYQVEEICDLDLEHSSVYEAGNIPTLMMIVDSNGGYTAIPELHINLLREEYREHIRPFVNPVPYRNVSLFVRNDYVRERILNIMAEAIIHIIPRHMLDEHLLKYKIHL